MKFSLMLILSIGLIASASLAADAPATAPTTAPVSKAMADEARGLIEQLNSSDWHQRQKAQDRLANMGSDIAPLLREAARKAPDDEVRMRIEAALRQIAQTERWGPTLVTLHVKESPAQNVAAELSKQGHIEIGLWSNQQWANVVQANVTIDADREPFWLVMKQFCQQTGLAPYAYGANTGRKITLMPGGSNWARLPGKMQGCFYVMPASASRSHTIDYSAPENVSGNFSLQFTVMVDPKLQVARYSSTLRLDEATDEKGNSLIGAAMAGGSYSSGSPFQCGLSAQLQYKPGTGKRLAVLKGSASFSVMEKLDTWELGDILKASDVVHLLPSGKYTLKQVTRVGAAYTGKVSINAPAEGNQPPMSDGGSLHQNLRLVDAAGKSYVVTGTSGSGRGMGYDYTVNFSARGGEEGNPGEPVKMIWQIPVEMKELTVPVEFKDLPIP